jgi:hypothetical protein
MRVLFALHKGVASYQVGQHALYVTHIRITLPLVSFQLLFTELFFTLLCMFLFVTYTSVPFHGFLTPFCTKVEGWVQIRIA